MYLVQCSLYLLHNFFVFFFFKQKTAYEMRISDWSSDVCSSDLDLLELDILPDVEFGPVRQRKDADALALRLARIIQPPQFWALVLGIPAVAGRTEREDALLGPGFLLITARAAERRVEARSEEHTSALQSLMRISYAVF